MTSRVNLLFGLLVAATVLTWLLGVESSASHTVAGLGVLTIGFVKLRLVGMHFMEIGNAPVVLRGIFEGYVAVVFAVLATLYVVL